MNRYSLKVLEGRVAACLNLIQAMPTDVDGEPIVATLNGNLDALESNLSYAQEKADIAKIKRERAEAAAEAEKPRRGRKKKEEEPA